MRRFVVLLVALACGACANSAPKAAADADASLEVKIVLDKGAQREGALLCSEGTATGWGYLQPQASARAACDAVLRDANGRLLTQPPSTDRMCTQVYGGPQRGIITGSVRGKRVDTTITRANGCGIGDWQALEALLGKPE